MHDVPPPPRAHALASFLAPALRRGADEAERLAEATERVLAEHPAWPWPLIEAEARRRAAQAGADPP